VPVVLDQSEVVSTVRLEGDVDIGAAQELKGVLMEALASRKELRVELADANALDVTIFQLLWAAERAAGKAGTGFSVRGKVPEEIVLAMDHAGLERLPVAQK
jgi:anti-anti-sigma regulatory factor